MTVFARALGMVFLSVLLLAGPSAASAQDDQARARALFEAGRAAVAEGDYEGAYRYFAEAYELSERPRLLFNMANAAERMRNDEEALRLYRQYIEEVPDAPNTTYVNTRIEALVAAEEARAAEREPAEPEAQTPIVDPVEEPPPPAEPPFAGIGLLGAGAAVAVVGAILLGVAAAEQGAVDGAPIGSSWSDYEASHNNANTFYPLGGVLVPVGVVAAAVGVALIVTAGPGGEEVALVPTGNGALLRGSF